MNKKTKLAADEPADLAPLGPPLVSRDDMRQAVVKLLWAQAHILARIAGREGAYGAGSAERLPSAFDFIAGRVLDGHPDRELDLPAGSYGVTWASVADTHFARVMEALYDFGYLGAFDPRYYPQELGDETSAWWVALYLKDVAASKSLGFQANYSGLEENEAAKLLLQVVETANARNLLEGAEETFVEDSTPGFLTIRELALVSGFKEESLRVLANPKRKNPLPTQSLDGSTVVAASDARQWLQLKDRYTPITARRSAQGALNLATARFDDPIALCEALGDHVSALFTQGEAVKLVLAALQSLYPKAFWQRPAAREGMLAGGLDLSPPDLQDATRLRALATALGFNPELLVLKAEEAALRANLADLESRMREHTSR